MEKKNHTIKKATKKDLRLLIVKYRPDEVTVDTIDKIVKLLPYNCLSIVGQAFFFQLMLTRLLEKYKVVRKLHNKLFWKEYL